MHRSASDQQFVSGVPAVAYQSRLRRRVWGAASLAVASLALLVLALLTRVGQAADTLVMEALAGYRCVLGQWASVSTGVVSVVNVGVATAVVVAVAVMRRRWSLAGRAVLIIVVSNVVTQLLKWLVVRPDLGVTYVLPNSLPSGHVTVAASLAVAAVVVAPHYLRSFVVWGGWLWVSFMGVTVMVRSWHRLSDVVVAVMIVGVCALVLAPIESQARHFVVSHRVMTLVVAVCLLAAAGVLCGGLCGVDVVEAARSAQGDGGFDSFLTRHPQRAALVAGGGVLAVVGCVGAVIHEVDRLRWPLFGVSHPNS